jgi:hypothetical protein
MMVAVMAHTVTMVRRIPGDIDVEAVMTRLRSLGGGRQESRQAAVMGIDVDRHAHAGAQEVRILTLVERDPYRD